MFQALKKQISDNFKRLPTSPLFCVAIDRDEIWNQYISGFDEEVRQEHNCNCCRSFLRQFGNIVTIKDGKVVSIWDNIETPEEYAGAIQHLRDYIHSRPITDIFLGSHKNCGTDRNLDTKRGVTWEHFYIELPISVVKSNVDTLLAQARDTKNVFKRGLDELTIDATTAVLGLIEENTLYRGKEFEAILKEFLKFQKDYKKSPSRKKDNFCWANSIGTGVVAKLRSTAIGTLLIDLSAGMELDAAVRSFESKVAPGNYKRPTALVTSKMVEQAKQTLSDLGLLGSLERRFANETDITSNNLLYKFRPSPIPDVFAEISQESFVNPKSFSNAETITIDDFISKIIPESTSIEVLLENPHLANMFSLVTAQDNKAPSLLKWDNQFSWDYTGGVADSIKERVKAAGGKVDGVLRFSIQWNDTGKNKNDFDAHSTEPSGNEIFFRNCKKPGISPDSGQLDVDIIDPRGQIAVENITWSNKSKMKYGTTKFFVHNYSSGTSNGGFTAQVEFEGETYDFEYVANLKGGQRIDVAEVTYSKEGFTLKSLLSSKASVNSKEKWGLQTNRFHKVTNIMLSPNHWVGTDRVGNKHYFFALDKCVSDESPRPFFNEYLKLELDVHRKVFEILGSKVKIDPAPNQISGIGFSETQRAYLIAKVQGKKFTRIFKINF